MRAALFSELGSLPVLRELPDPVAGPGDVVVDVFAAPVLAYANEVFRGERPMLFELPFTPGTGAVGRVRELGEGASALHVGDWVYCDPNLRARDGGAHPPISLQGLTASGPAAIPVQRQYRHGSWAERLRLPLENVIPLGEIDEDSAGSWLVLGSMLVPYGGFSSVKLQAGETVVVNGATGSFGSAAVAVALAMGAAWVVVTGRSEVALAALRTRHGPRVRPARMRGEADADCATIQAAAGEPIDVVFDILPPQATPDQVLAAVRAVRPGGRISLMGGVGMADGGGELRLPYPWLMRNNITVRGQWMYPRDAVARLLSLAKCGVLDLFGYEIVGFPLEDLDQAIEHARQNTGPFSRTVLRPIAR